VRRLLIACVLGVAAACAGNPSDPRPEGIAASVVGTPFLMAFKIPACVVTLAAAGPAGAAAEMTSADPSDRAVTLRQALDDGIRQNCGPPYVIAP